jgi:hypothetical protein
MPKQRHMKLSDVEGQKTYPFRGPATSFEKAYPMIESLRLEVRPCGEGVEPFRGEREWLEIYTERRIVAILDCRNPRCHGGGLDLDRLLRWGIVEPKLTEYERTVHCSGFEGTPKGRRKDGPCDTYFKVKASVKYKE